MCSIAAAKRTVGKYEMSVLAWIQDRAVAVGPSNMCGSLISGLYLLAKAQLRGDTVPLWLADAICGRRQLLTRSTVHVVLRPVHALNTHGTFDDGL